MTDIPGNSSTTASVTVGSTTNGTLDFVGDHDWYKITLTAGQSITVTINGVTLEDPYLYVRDSSGNLLFQNDDISAGINRNSQLSFTANYTGTYYIDVGAFDADPNGPGDYAGDYQVVVTTYSPPPLVTMDQIADQLVNGYWGGAAESHHFDVTQGGTITVNISKLNAAEKTLALAALAEWSDIIGVHFQQVATGGQIIFDHNEDPSDPGPIAATDANWSFGITSWAHVQISTSWVNTYGTTLDSYSFQTYVHEIGHALGLGHAGNYNGDATYPYDALFQNDAWSTSIMSYFSQRDNTYFLGQGFSEDYAVTPMLADIVAMQQLYGLSTTTRTGDTTYGYNSNAGGVYNASLYPDVAYTIFDSGGTDTLDFSVSSSDQLINLNPETFSNVNGQTGNLAIARGVVIEKAIGGAGNDTIIGNGANNVLNGGAGSDTLSYETANAGVTVNLAITLAQDTGGAGIDTLSNFEKIVGSAFADVLTGGPAVILMSGGAGDDLLVLGPGPETADGGSGFDTVDCSQLTSGVQLAMDARYGLSPYSVGNVEKIIGTNYADTLVAGNSGGVLIGGAGDDALSSPWGNAQLAGGTGNDTYDVTGTSDQIIESPGEGTDLVIARMNFVLGANLENLTLLEANADPYAGASLPPGPVQEDWNASGNDLANVVTGNDGANVLSGLAGNDTLVGNGGSDSLSGGSGGDILTGGAAADSLAGGSDVDTFKDTASGLNGDTITDLAIGEKIVITDATLAGFTFNLSGNTLSYTGGSLTLQGLPAGQLVASAAAGGGVQLLLQPPSATEGDDNITGTELADEIHALGGNDTVTALGGDDLLDGGAGNDTLDGGSGSDTASYASAISAVTVNLVTGLASGGAGNDTLANIENLIGSSFADQLSGDGGANVLEGGGGNDLLDGNGGSDTASYSTAASGVSVSLALAGAQNTGGAGSDTLTSIENLTGSAFSDTLTGDTGANVLTGRGGNDILVGGAGADVMIGGLGDDRFYIDTLGDVVTEAAGEGDDWAFVLGTYTLEQGVSVETLVALNQSSTEPLVLTGNDYGQSLYGNLGDNYLNGGQGADYLVGLGGNDSLLGGTGADHLEGGAGNDVYYVDDALDLVTEVSGEGDDLVVATASYALNPGASVETMSADPSGGNINLTGNELAQSLYGNGGNNILTGLGGADYLVGGAGNDKYYVDTADFIAEEAGGGDDWIFVADTYILREGAEIETLVAVNQDSLDAVNLTGNEFGQSLYGSQGANSLNGGGGNDYLVGLGGNDFLVGGAGNDNLAGGSGNDVYYVDSGDQIVENANEGDDLAVALQSFALGSGQSVETLSAADGAGAINLTGNALAQSLYGNAGNNVLTTGGGADYLVGGGGNDTFVLSNAPGVATIGDYAAGDVVDISQILNVAGGTDVTGGGYLKVTSGGQIQVDPNGGGDAFVTIGNINGSSAVTVRYVSGGSATDVSVARSAGMTAMAASPSVKPSADAQTGTDLPQHTQALAPIALDDSGAMHAYASFATHDAFALNHMHADWHVQPLAEWLV